MNKDGGEVRLENPSMNISDGTSTIVFDYNALIGKSNHLLNDVVGQPSKQTVNGNSKTGNKQCIDILNVSSTMDKICNTDSNSSYVSKSTSSMSILNTFESDGIVNSQENNFQCHNNKNGKRAVCMSSCKRKAASPRKRLLSTSEPIEISSETGEVLDCSLKKASCSDAGKLDCAEVNLSKDGGPHRRKKISKSNTNNTSNSSYSSSVPLYNNTNHLLVPDIQTFASMLKDGSNHVGAALISRKEKNGLLPDVAASADFDKHLPTELLNNLINSDAFNINLFFDTSQNTPAMNAILNNLMFANGQDTNGRQSIVDMMPLLNTLLPFMPVPHTVADGVHLNSNANLAFLEAAAAASAAAGSGTYQNLMGRAASESIPLVSSTSTLPERSNVTKKALNVNCNTTKSSKKGENYRYQANSMNKTSSILRQSYSTHLSLEKLPLKLKISTRDDELIRNAANSAAREERIDLEELESFAQKFKRQRIKFGFTQGDVGMALGRRYGTDFSQTTISRFEALNLSFKNMCKLRPLLKEWLADAEAAIANGASVSELLEAAPGDSQSQVSEGGRSMTVKTTIMYEPPSPNGSGISASSLPLRKRRKRTNLDSSQRSALDTYFKLNPRPDHDKMARIAELLELDRDVVRVWFCNRRQKLRRE